MAYIKEERYDEQTTAAIAEHYREILRLLGEDPERVTFSKVYIPYFSGLARKFTEFDKKIAQLDETES